jgi:hypothetical protein
MKKTFLLLLAVLMIAACKKDSISHENDFAVSYRAWLNYKQAVNNSYSYVVQVGSWTGYGTETVLHITNGKITGRTYKAYRLEQNASGPPTNVVLKTWVEDPSTLNTHPQDGAVLLTLDEVYAKAKSVWLAADKKTNDVYFEASNNGLISSCGFVPQGCQDDCFDGITITSIKPTI